jgi:hypothetical protein
VFIVVAALSVWSVAGLNNGVGLTPAMGSVVCTSARLFVSSSHSAMRDGVSV